MAEEQQATLSRNLSLPFITFYGIGTILGAGIYVLVGEVAGSAGMFAPASFAVAAVLAAFSAFAYAELVARYPRSAGEAVYVQHGLGLRWLSISVGFLVIMVGVVSCATMSRGFVGYFQVFVGLPAPLIITVLVLMMGALAAWGIKESVTAATFITLVEIGGLLLVMWAARGSLAELPARLPELAPPADPGVWFGILVGAFIAFYAYIGFEDMVNVAEEVKRPTRNLPVAIILALVVTTTLYMAVAVTAVLALPPSELAGVGAPLAKIYTETTGREPTAISIIAMFAVLNGALIQIIMASRILYGMSRQGWLPARLGSVSPKTHTPLIATGIIIAVILVLALGFPLLALAKATSFITLTIFALINLALVFIKRRDPHPEGIRVYPMWIPLFGFLTTVGFAGFQLFALFR